MFKIIKKFLFKKKEFENKQGISAKLKEKAGGLSSFVADKAEQIREELVNMRHKMSNLLDTNYKLGMKHLENGNLSDAIFRFNFITKFWPHYYDAYYQLAYTLVLKKKYNKAYQRF